MAGLQKIDLSSVDDNPRPQHKHKPKELKITALKKQESRDRVSVFVNEKYSFSLTIDQVLNYSLRNGQVLSEGDVANYKKQSLTGKHLGNAIDWSLRRPHSSKELREYLYKKQIDNDMSAEITNYLLEKGYINDAGFTKFWVDSRCRSKNPSRRMLVSELKSKGVSDQIIQQQLEEAEFDEEEMLKQHIAKKSKLSRYKDNEKLKQYLARQGFAYDIINRALSQ